MIHQFFDSFRVIGRTNRIKSIKLLIILVFVVCLELLSIGLIVPILSGLFDIEPHRHSSIQKDIRLTKKDTKNFSPMYLRPFSAAPSIVAVGGKESDLFHWQSLRYAAHLRLHGIKAHFVSTKDDNHFTITDRLGDSRSSLTKMFIRQMNLG